MLELSKLLVDTKSTWVEYPDLEGFEVEVAMVSRPELTKLRKKCLSTKWDKKTRGNVESLDEKKFVELFTEATLKGWKGFTLKGLSALALTNLGDLDPETEVEWTPERGLLVVSSSAEFDTWLNEVVFDLDTFRN